MYCVCNRSAPYFSSHLPDDGAQMFGRLRVLLLLHRNRAMDAVTSRVWCNRLLSRASADDRHLLQPHLKPVTLALRFELEKPNTPIENVYFMDAGIASVVAVQRNERRIDVGLIGCEGMTGAAVA